MPKPRTVDVTRQLQATLRPVAREPFRLIVGDMREMLAREAPSSIDSIVCDPPYELGFMGREWDSSGVAFDVATWRACLRVLKPGGHLLAFGGTRTWHRIAVAIEDAGFEIRDTLCWLYGQGFPKSLDVSKAIDAHLGAEREVVGSKLGLPGYSLAPSKGAEVYGGGIGGRGIPEREVEVTAPGSPEAEQWAGWGTALKPAFEPVVVARRPLIGSVAGNALAFGVGGINVDGCRIEGGADYASTVRVNAHAFAGPSSYTSAGTDALKPGFTPAAGRWPANVALGHSLGCVELGTKRVRTSTGARGASTHTYGGGKGFTAATGEVVGYAGADGKEAVAAWDCTEDCAVRMLDAQSGVLLDGGPIKAGAPVTNQILGATGVRKAMTFERDKGGASRFFYTAKPSTAERERGLFDLPARAAAELTDREPDSAGLDSPRAGAGRTSEGRRNHHPTVKPTSLMRWLVRLVTPPGGTVLDPFTGSGTTGVAAMAEGLRFVGVELDTAHAAIAWHRIVEAIEEAR